MPRREGRGGGLGPGRSACSDPFDDRTGPEPPTAAHRDQPVATFAAFEFVQRRSDESGAGRSGRVPECDRAAVRVHFGRIRARPEKRVVKAEELKDLLGPPKFINEMAERTDISGVATGLAWTAAGGDILFIEASKMLGKGGLTLTGQLGDVMKTHEAC